MIATAAKAAEIVRRPWGRMLVAFAALPTLLTAVPAIAGLTWLSGDNLIQNFPLRVLVGLDLRHGHAPVRDPYIWSGSPLLSAFNAGAAYPVTWLFAVLPGAMAWVVNQATVEIAAAFGMVVLLRVLGRSWAASGLGALAFTYGGFMAAQSVHIDIVEAGAWLPWAFAGLERAANPGEGRSAAPWVAMLGGAIGLMGLTGAAEPILDGGMVLGLYALWLLWRSRHRLRLLVRIAVGVVVGLAVASAQLVPGALVQAQSQRALHSYWYFTSGSMNKSLTVLGLDPLLLGTNHSFAVPFYATYNIPEVTSYVGILPLMGVFGLLARRMRRHPGGPRYGIWYGVLALGLVLTWGDFTPLGHVFYHLPLFNRQRLLSRNLLEVDLAVAVLFAVWVDHMFLDPVPTLPRTVDAIAKPGAARAVLARLGARGWGSDVVLALVPPAAVVVLQLVMLAGGAWLPHLLHVPGHVTRGYLLPLVGLLTVASAISITAAVLVVRRLSLAQHMVRLLAAVMLVDLVFFNVFIQGGVNPASATGDASLANQFAAVVAAQGLGTSGTLHREAIYDPDAVDSVQVDELGEAELNILRQLPSVQGYGPVVAAGYDQATGSHRQLSLTPAALANGVFSQLDLAVLASVPQYFVHLVTAPVGMAQASLNEGTDIPPRPPDPDAPPDRTPAPPTPAGEFGQAPPPSATVALRAGHTRTQFLGTVLTVSSVAVPLTTDDPAGTSVRVGLLSADGRRTTWLKPTPPAAGTRRVTARVATPTPAVGIVLEARKAPGALSSAVTIGAVVVRTAGQGTYRVDGTLRDVVAPSTWRYAGMVGPFCVFTRSDLLGHAWVAGVPGATARLVSSLPWGDETIRVDTARRATLVRSEQFATGWQATVTVDGTDGRTRTRRVDVRPDGLVQAVTVPAGTSLVHFTYRPHRVLEGFLISVAGVVAVAGLVATPWVRRRRRGSQERVARRSASA